MLSLEASWVSFASPPVAAHGACGLARALEPKEVAAAVAIDGVRWCGEHHGVSCNHFGPLRRWWRSGGLLAAAVAHS